MSVFLMVGRLRQRKLGLIVLSLNSKRQTKTAEECDTFNRKARKVYCYLTRAGVTSSIKRGARRRERREGKRDVRHTDFL
jgi:hypothetical protein